MPKGNFSLNPQKGSGTKNSHHFLLCDLKEKHHLTDRLQQRLGTKSLTTEIPLYNMKKYRAMTAAWGFPLRNEVYVIKYFFRKPAWEVVCVFNSVEKAFRSSSALQRYCPSV